MLCASERQHLSFRGERAHVVGGLVGLAFMMSAIAFLWLLPGARHDESQAPVSIVAESEASTVAGAQDAATPLSFACDAIAALVADAGVSIPADVAGSVPLTGGCLRTRKGAWGVVVTQVTTPPNSVLPCEQAIEVSYTILHADHAGHLARAPRKASISPCDFDRVPVPKVSDLDGDGEDELVIPFMHDGPGGADEGPHREVGKILAFRGGKIVDVTHGLHFHEANDVDGDGHVDLVTFSPYEIMLEQGGCMGGQRALPGPALLLHSLADGGFSRDDDVAKKFALKECASVPAHLVLAQDGGLERSENAVENIACAKLWGMSEARVETQITTECAKSDELGVALGQGDDGKSDCFTASNTEICLDGGIAWARPPLRLDP
jgi:hypothetical protein